MSGTIDHLRVKRLQRPAGWAVRPGAGQSIFPNRNFR